MPYIVENYSPFENIIPGMLPGPGRAGIIETYSDHDSWTFSHKLDSFEKMIIKLVETSSHST